MINNALKDKSLKRYFLFSVVHAYEHRTVHSVAYVFVGAAVTKG